MSASVVLDVLDLTLTIVSTLVRDFFACSTTAHFDSGLTCTYLRLCGELLNNNAGAAKVLAMLSFKHKDNTALSMPLLNQATNALRHMSRKSVSSLLLYCFLLLRCRASFKTNCITSTKPWVSLSKELTSMCFAFCCAHSFANRVKGVENEFAFTIN